LRGEINSDLYVVQIFAPDHLPSTLGKAVTKISGETEVMNYQIISTNEKKRDRDGYNIVRCQLRFDGAKLRNSDKSYLVYFITNPEEYFKLIPRSK